MIGPRKITRCIEDLVRPHVVDLDEAYRDMAADAKRESEASEWTEELGRNAWEDITDEKSPEDRP